MKRLNPGKIVAGILYGIIYASSLVIILLMTPILILDAAITEKEKEEDEYDGF